MPQDVKQIVQERIEETKANSEPFFDQSDMYLDEFKQNMKSNANIRRGSDSPSRQDELLIDGLNDDSEGSLQDELGSLETELGSFNSFMGRAEQEDDDDLTSQMVEVLKNRSKIKDIDDIEEREDVDDLDSDTDEEDDQFNAMQLQRTDDENDVRITESSVKMEMAVNQVEMTAIDEEENNKAKEVIITKEAKK